MGEGENLTAHAIRLQVLVYFTSSLVFTVLKESKYARDCLQRQFCQLNTGKHLDYRKKRPFDALRGTSRFLDSPLFVEGDACLQGTKH